MIAQPPGKCPSRGIPPLLGGLLPLFSLLIGICPSAMAAGFGPEDFTAAGLDWPASRSVRTMAAGPDWTGRLGGWLRASELNGLGEETLARDSLLRWLADSPLSSARPSATLDLVRALAGRGDAIQGMETARAGRAAYPASQAADDFLFWEGECALRGEDYQSAEKAFSEYDAKYPGSPMRPRALYGLGWAESRLKSHSLAASHFEEAGRISPGLKPSSDLQRGWVLLESGDAAGAATLFGEVDRQYAGTRYAREAVVGSAECAYRAGDYERAGALYDAALARTPEPAGKAVLRYSLAWTALKKGEFARARGLFSDVARDYPGEPVAPFADYRSALCLLDLGKSAEALVELRKVEARHAGHDVAEWGAYSRGWIHLSEGRFNDAKAAFRALLDSYPDGRLVAPAAFLFATAMFRERRYADSEREFSSFAARFPSSGLADGALLWAAWSALMDSRPGDALAHTDRLAREFPGSAVAGEAALAEGEAAFALADYARAKRAYGRAAESRGDTRLAGLTGLGWCAFSGADWKEAERLFRKVLAEASAPGMKLRARARLADALFNQKRYSEAAAEYRTALAGGDEAISRWCQLELGWCALREERPDEARAQWEQLRRRWPRSPEAPLALSAIAETLFQQERFLDSERAFRALSREVSADSPLAESSALRTGDALYNAKSFEASILAWREFTQRYPKSQRLVEALYGIQWAYVQLGDYDKARQEAGAFLARYPSSGLAAEVALMVAESYKRERKFDDAVAQFRDLLERYPDGVTAPVAMMKLGETLEEAGRPEDALKTYSGLVAKYPGHPQAAEARFRTGVVKYATGDVEGAVAVFEGVASDKADSRAPEALYNLMLCRKKQGNEPAMADIIARLARDFPRSRAGAEADLAFAYFLQDLGRKDEAAPKLRSVVESPFLDLASEASSALGDWRAERGDSEGALKDYLKGAEALPRGGEWAVSCALSGAGLLRAAGRDDEAIDLLRRVLEKDDAAADWLAAACLGIAQSYAATGRPKQAKQMYQEAIKRKPSAELVQQAKAGLSALSGGASPSSTGLRDSGGKKSGGKGGKRAPAKKVRPAAKKKAVKR